MGNLLFFRRSCAYRFAARAELHKARLLPRGPERNQTRKRASALRDLARDEAWLEGQPPLRMDRRDAAVATVWPLPNASIARGREMIIGCDYVRCD
jgi:hypothetical protein